MNDHLRRVRSDRTGSEFFWWLIVTGILLGQMIGMLTSINGYWSLLMPVAIGLMVIGHCALAKWLQLLEPQRCIPSPRPSPSGHLSSSSNPLQTPVIAVSTATMPHTPMMQGRVAVPGPVDRVQPVIHRSVPRSMVRPSSRSAVSIDMTRPYEAVGEQ